MVNPKFSFRRIDIEGDFFEQALNFTAEKLGFNPMLIEKDYYCSLVLAYLYSRLEDILIFKGGTALNKVHVGFYRLSEDLDFSISMSLESTRSQRSKAAEPIKKVFSELPQALSGLKTSTPLSGRNNSLQYIGEVEYPSRFTASPGMIQVEVGMREPNLLPTHLLNAKTALLSPINEKPLVEVIPVRVYDAKETLAEKLRALFCRREPAIRDLFDVKHLIENSILSPDDENQLEIARRKITVPGNVFFGLSSERIALLRSQLDSELKPVLQEKVYADFDFEESLQQAKKIQNLIRKSG